VKPAFSILQASFDPSVPAARTWMATSPGRAAAQCANEGLGFVYTLRKPASRNRDNDYCSESLSVRKDFGSVLGQFFRTFATAANLSTLVTAGIVNGANAGQWSGGG